MKPAAAELASPDQGATVKANNDRVQAWMPVMIAPAQTAEAILALPIGGPTAAE